MAKSETACSSRFRSQSKCSFNASFARATFLARSAAMRTDTSILKWSPKNLRNLGRSLADSMDMWVQCLIGFPGLNLVLNSSRYLGISPILDDIQVAFFSVVA